MLTAADVGLVTDVMKGINAPESLIQSITTLLTSNSDGLVGTEVLPVGTGHFGGSTNGHRLGVNALALLPAAPRPGETRCGIFRTSDDWPADSAMDQFGSLVAGISSHQGNSLTFHLLTGTGRSSGPAPAWRQ